MVESHYSDPDLLHNTEQSHVTKMSIYWGHFFLDILFQFPYSVSKNEYLSILMHEEKGYASDRWV